MNILLPHIKGFIEASHPEAPPSPIPMCFTQHAMAKILGTVGMRHPETGAKGFGPKDKQGFDVIEFDEVGSSNASSGIYTPDVKWGDERLDFWLSRDEDEMRLWTGDLHSHPGRIGHPSRKSGPGLGDLGYVEEAFRLNEPMQFFFIPILTNTGPRQRVIEIHPWIVSRDAPDQPMYARVEICDVEAFPLRRFNPEWELRAMEPTPSAIKRERLEELLDVPVESHPLARGALELRLRNDGLVLTFVIPRDFPRAHPQLYVATEEDAHPTPVPFRWAGEKSDKEPERRLASLCSIVTNCMNMRF